jgi:hypothetical protein
MCRRTLARRRRPLPPLGDASHLTAILRIGALFVPRLRVDERHYVYPPHTVHVTVANLDAADVDLDDAIDRLRSQSLPAPEFVVCGLGCSPDTLFLKCVHDVRFVELRAAVSDAFDLQRAPVGATRLFERLSFANIVRFDGRGEWPHVTVPDQRETCRELEIVRTDRYLSDSATIIEARVALGTTA